MKGKVVVTLYRHGTVQVLTEINRWTLKTGAAWFSENTIKKLDYKLCSSFNYPASYSDKSVPWLDDWVQMWAEQPANYLRYYPSVYLEGLRKPQNRWVRTVSTPAKIQTGHHWTQARITTTSNNLLCYVPNILVSDLPSFLKKSNATSSLSFPVSAATTDCTATVKEKFTVFFHLTASCWPAVHFL